MSTARRIGLTGPGMMGAPMMQRMSNTGIELLIDDAS